MVRVCLLKWVDMRWRKELLVIMMIQITEVLGFSLILPFLPFYAESMGASPLVVALILSSFSLLQFISAPVMGRLSDMYGRKPLLIASQISTFISFVILGRAGSLAWIFISRAVDGLLGSNNVIAQAYVSDISSEEERSKAFGVSGISFAVGFMIGPALGGYLSRFGYSVPAYVAAGMSMLSIILTVLLLEETVKRAGKWKKVKIFDWGAFVKYFGDEKLRRGFLIIFTYFMTHVIWTSNLSLYMKSKLGFGASEVGWMLAYVGLFSIVFRGLLLSKLIDKVGESRLTKISVLAIILGLLVLMGVRDFVWVLASLSLFAFGNGSTRPLMIGNISKGVDKNEQGAVLGVVNSLRSVAQIVGPVIGGYFLSNFFPESVMLVAMLFMSVGMGVIWVMGRR